MLWEHELAACAVIPVNDMSRRMSNVADSICHAALLVTKGDFDVASLVADNAEKYFEDALLITGGKKLPILYGRQRIVA